MAFLPQALQIELPSASRRQSGVSVVLQFEQTVGPIEGPFVPATAGVVAIEDGSVFLNSNTTPDVDEGCC